MICLLPACATLGWNSIATLNALRSQVWTDDQDQPVHLADLGPNPIVISMFYQGCTGTCPLTVERMRVIERDYARRKTPVTLVLVTLDPRHDTSLQLAAYRQAHHLDGESWVLLRGPVDQTVALAGLLGIHRIDDSSHIMHVGKIALLDFGSARVSEIW